MNVLHVFMCRKLSSGIFSQMYSEQKAANDAGLAWHSRIFVPSKERQKILSEKSDDLTAELLVSEANVKDTWMQFRIAFYHWLSNIESNYDAIILRHSCYDPFQVIYMRGSKKPVYLMHHTLEVNELRTSGVGFNRLKAPLEAFIGRFSLKAAAGLVGVTPEIAEYECRRAGLSDEMGSVYPNGISLASSMVVSDHRVGVPRFLFLASRFLPWHGLDLLLEAITDSQECFKIDLVGELNLRDKQIAEQDDRIILHGKLSNNQIRELAGYSDLGISSLALFRNGMNDACPLKTREYLAMGLPVYGGYNDVLPDFFPYYKKGSVDLRAIIDYAKEVRKTGREEVSEKASLYIDKSEILGQLYGWISEKSGSNR